MDNLAQLLGDKAFNQPPEIKIIKDFVKKSFDENCSVKVSKFNISITVPNAALAGALKEKLEILKEQLTTQKNISINIGNI